MVTNRNDWAVRRAAKGMVVAIAAMLLCSTGVFAWEVEYDAATGLLPSSAVQSWQASDFGAPTSVADGSLHIGADGGMTFRREPSAIPAGVPITMETRLRVVGSLHATADIGVGTYGRIMIVGLFPDHILTTDRYGESHTYSLDFTDFHTIRLAYDGSDTAYLWVDDQLAFSYVPRGWGTTTPGGVSFGSGGCDSYWQYVAYSKEFLPIPEPSSLLALFAGLGGCFGTVLRRRLR